jgi:hypothetical protein
MKKLLFFGWLTITQVVFGQEALGEVVGTVVEEKSGAIVYGAQVFITDQVKKYQAITGPDGRFRILAIPAGKYQLNIKYAADTLFGIPVNVPMDGICNAGTIKFISGVLNLGPVDASANGKGIKLEYGFLPVKALTSEEIERSPDKFNIKNLVISMSPDVKVSEDGELMFRGARKGDMVYMMDGMKSNEVSTVPSCAIGRVMVYTGGLPAKYGDTLGGVVVMETKGYFDLYRQWEATEIKTGKK